MHPKTLCLENKIVKQKSGALFCAQARLQASWNAGGNFVEQLRIALRIKNWALLLGMPGCDIAFAQQAVFANAGFVKFSFFECIDLKTFPEGVWILMCPSATAIWPVPSLCNWILKQYRNPWWWYYQLLFPIAWLHVFECQSKHSLWTARLVMVHSAWQQPNSVYSAPYWYQAPVGWLTVLPIWFRKNEYSAVYPNTKSSTPKTHKNLWSRNARESVSN